MGMRLSLVCFAWLCSAVASAQATWYSRTGVAEIVAQQRVPELTQGSGAVVYPLEIQGTDKAKLSPDDLRAYTERTLPALVRTGKQNNRTVFISVNLPLVGEESAAQFPPEEFERSVVTAFRKDPYYRYVNELGLRRRFVQLRDRLAKLREAGPFQLLIDLRFPRFPLLLQSSFTREWAVRETSFDPIDVPELEGYSSDRVPVIDELTGEAIRQLAERTRARYLATLKQLWTEFQFPKAILVAEPRVEAAKPYGLIHRRLETVDLAALPFAEGICLYATTAEELSAISATGLKRLPMTLPVSVAYFTGARATGSPLPTLGRPITWLEVK